jgi:hypothetical protein
LENLSRQITWQEQFLMGSVAGTGETDQNQLTLNSRGGRRQKGMESENILSKQLYLSGNACFRVELWKIWEFSSINMNGAEKKYKNPPIIINITIHNLIK